MTAPPGTRPLSLRPRRWLVRNPENSCPPDRLSWATSPGWGQVTSPRKPLRAPLKTQRHISHALGSFEKPREGKFPAKKGLKNTRRRIVILRRGIWGDSLLVRGTWSSLLSGWQKIPTGVPSRMALPGLTGTCVTGSRGRSPAPHVAPFLPHLPVAGQGLRCSGVLLVPLPLPHSLKLSCSPA